MNLDLYDRVHVAYKKLKRMVYYDKHPLTLRRRLAEFECEGDFEGRLDIVVKVAESKAPHETSEFKTWLEEIRFDVIPKSVENSVKLSGGNGTFVTNFTSDSEHRVTKVNYMFDGPVELHLLSVLWLMIEGFEYDHTLSDHCSGSRLHQLVGNNDKDKSASLFRKYHELYAKWRDSGIKKARDLLSDDRQSVCLVGLDVQEYYYRIQLNWEELRSQIERSVSKSPPQDFVIDCQDLGSKLLKCIETVCKSYQLKLSPMLAITHSDLPDLATCLPIGFSASPVIANWYLKKFDDAILENIRPAYYGRYLDDILMVVAMSNPPEEKDPIISFMNRVLVDSKILNYDEAEKRFELCCRPGLFLQKKKCVLQYFDAEHSLAGLDKFQQQIEENASDFALLPMEGDDSPVTQVAYDLLYDGSVNKFRSVKAVAENRRELASQLAKQTQLHLLTEGTVDKKLKDELFRFFKGRNAIDYWDMWERVISFFLVAGDQKSSEDFKQAMHNEIKKMMYESINGHLMEQIKQMSNSLKASLKAHLDICMELSFAVTGSTKIDSSAKPRLWRESNLIRHHLVAIPLLNYTSYKGNLASPSTVSELMIDQKKAVNTPRFVHFDECLEFVDSSCIQGDERDMISRAKDVFKQFHSFEFNDVTSEIVEEDSK